MAMDISGLNKAVLNTQRKLDELNKKKPDIGIARVNIEDVGSINENYPIGTLIAINDPVNNTDSILGGLHLYCGENDETNELIFSRLANEQDIQYLNHYIHQINSYTDTTSIFIGSTNIDINWKIIQYSDNTAKCYGQFSFKDNMSLTYASSTITSLPITFSSTPHINVELVNGGIRTPSSAADCSNVYGEVKVANISESKFALFVYDPKRLNNRTVQIELYGEQLQAD